MKYVYIVTYHSLLEHAVTQVLHENGVIGRCGDGLLGGCNSSLVAPWPRDSCGLMRHTCGTSAAAIALGCGGRLLNRQVDAQFSL